VGYVVAARELLARLALARFAGDFQTDALAQATLAELLADGGLERHLRRVRRVYAARRAALLAALSAHMPAGTRFAPPAGGNAVWVALPEGTDGEWLLGAARREGIAYARGDAFFLDGSGRDHLSLCFARLPEARLAEGVERLARLVRRAQEGSR
jgi:DNA-binding transcriptional MocR family regulator